MSTVTRLVRTLAIELAHMRVDGRRRSDLDGTATLEADTT
jgi:hypothetical protein